MEPIDLRPASVADSPAIADLTSQLGYAASPEEIASRLETLLARKDFFITVAQTQGRVVGWVAAEQRTLLESEARIEIVGLVVASTHRRRGIGTSLVAAVEEWRSESRVSTIFVRSNVARTESHAFYENIGYVRHKTQHAYVKHAGFE